MCPRMIDGPRVPGVGEPRYQPAGESGSSSEGTCTVPSELRPRSINAEPTPSAGMIRVSGCDGGRTSPVVGAEVCVRGDNVLGPGCSCGAFSCRRSDGAGEFHHGTCSGTGCRFVGKTRRFT